MRLDISLQKMGLTYSRQKAKELIKQGHISVNGSICFKPSYLIKDGDDVKIIGETLKYVGLDCSQVKTKLKLIRYIAKEFGVTSNGRNVRSNHWAEAVHAGFKASIIT